MEDPAGGAVAGALVTLREVDSQTLHITTADRDGRFAFAFLLPGRYELLAEALGRRPVLVESLRLEPGRAARISVSLVEAAPPVERRDTLLHAGLPEAAGASLSWADPGALRALPDRVGGIAFLASLSSLADEGLGTEGLPGRFTRLYADGQAFEPARHPGSGGESPEGLAFPASSVAGAAVLRGTSDVEWAGGAGGFLALSTGVHRPGVPELVGLGTSDALWSASGFEGDAPSFTSIRGRAGTTLTLVPDTARLHFAFEASRDERPVGPVLGDSVSAILFPPDGGGAEGAPSPLTRPGLREVTSTSGSARLDWSLGDEGRVQARVGGAAFSVEGAPSPGGESGDIGLLPTVEGADATGSANLIVSLQETLALEIRGGASVSRRDVSSPTDGPETLLLDPVVAVGTDPGLGGEVRRTDLGGSAALHMVTGPHRLKGGVAARLASHVYDVVDNANGTFLFGDALAAGTRGLFVDVEGTAPRTSFTVPEIGAFFQYRWNPVPHMILTGGVRYDLEILPSDDVRRDARWAELTGLENDAFDDRIGALGARLHASWDLTGRSRTVLEGGVAVEHGDVDPAALHESILNGGQLTVHRIAGELASWPDRPAAGATTRSTGATLTLLSPGISPPRSTRAVLGFAHRFGDATTLRVVGSARRTEFLLRREDLNRPLEAAANTVHGRRVLAPLVSEGGILAPDPLGWRRFPEYDAVWALNTDGWSKYRGLTVGVEQALPGRGVLFANYTFSETTDNLVGLRRARPGATLDPGLDTGEEASWAEGVSDFDVPHRLAAGAILRLPGATLTGVYRLRSGPAFTPMVRMGLDVNADGVWANDVAFVPDVEEVRALSDEWDCLARSIRIFAERNGCRADPVHTVDLRLSLGPFRLGPVPVEIVVDALNVTDGQDGIRDDALLVLDRQGELTTDETGRLAIPYRVNPSFGSFLMRTDPGRLVRIGVRIGAP